MVGLFIVGGILVLLIGIGSIKGALCVSCQNLTNVKLTVRVCGIKIISLPGDPTRIRIADYSRAAMERKVRRAQKKNAKKAKKSENNDKPNTKKEKATKGNLNDTVSLITAMLQSILSRLGKNVKLIIHHWHIVIGTDDAAKTALLYAAAQNGTNFLFAFLDETTTVVFPNDGIPYVTADFGTQKSSIDAELRIDVRVGQALRLLLCTAIDFLKYKQTHKKEG